MNDEKKTILVVDDDLDFLTQVAFVLERNGYTVKTAQNQEEAERMLESLRPHLAILDLMMEHHDSGFVLAYRLKKRYPDVPIIIVTAVTSETGIRFDAVGPSEQAWSKADIIMDKGIRHDQLLREVRRLLREE